jgi:hypothetical protein
LVVVIRSGNELAVCVSSGNLVDPVADSSSDDAEAAMEPVNMESAAIVGAQKHLIVFVIVVFPKWEAGGSTKILTP